MTAYQIQRHGRVIAEYESPRNRLEAWQLFNDSFGEITDDFDQIDDLPHGFEVVPVDRAEAGAIMLTAIQSPGREELNQIPVREVVRSDSGQSLGTIGYEGGRWFVLSGFGDRLPFRWQLHLTLSRSLKILEYQLEKLDGSK